VPPAAVTVAWPLAPPLQLTFVCAVMDAVNTRGSVILTEVVAVQLLASETVTLYVPCVRPVAIAVVCTGAGSFHK
jgi:hypothetical protein